MHTHTHASYTVWQFISGGWNIFRKGWRYFVGLAAIVSITQYILMIGWTLLMSGIAVGGMIRGSVFGMVLSTLVLIALYLYLGYMMLYIVKNLSLDHHFTLQGVSKQVHTHFWSLFLTALQKWVYLIGLFVLLIIPGIIYSVYRLFNQFVNVYDNVFYGDSLNDSKSLIHGRWRKTVGNLIVIGLVAVILFGISGQLLGITNTATPSMMNTNPMSVMQTTTGNVGIDILRSIVSGVLSAFFLCVLARMYLAYKETQS